MFIQFRESFFGKWPWLGASVVLVFISPWWFSLAFSLGCVFIFGAFWPAILTGFIIDSLYGPSEVLFFSKYRYAIFAAVLTILLLALRRRIMIDP